MDWKHKCNIYWLTARQHYLTASEIKALLPVTKTGRKRIVTDEDRIKIIANKYKNLTEDDCWSYGAAARGHILEPYAIEEFNSIAGESNKLFHWDDIIIPKANTLGIGGLAFSPDALNVKVPNRGMSKNPYVYWDSDFNTFKEIILGEVKCYGADKHFLTAYTVNNKVEERWQIATAMACCPKITEGYLILYHPGIGIENIVYKHWDRYDLREEIDIVLEIEEDWLEFVERWGKATPYGVSDLSLYNEEGIINKVISEQKLNP